MIDPFNFDFSVIPQSVIDGALLMTVFIVTIVMLNKLRIVLTTPVKPRTEYGDFKALITQLETLINAPRQQYPAPPPAIAPVMPPAPQYSAPYQNLLYQTPSYPQQVQIRVNPPPRPAAIIEIQVFPN